MTKIIVVTLALMGAVGTANANGSITAGKNKSAVCVACHGQDGNAPTGNTNPAMPYPKLADQHASYTKEQLKAFKSGERQNPIMMGMVAALSEQDMDDLAAYYASLDASIASVAAEKVVLGKTLYHGGNRAKHIPACMACHGPNGSGNPAARFPALSGQHTLYTIKRLKDFRDGGIDSNKPNTVIMRDIAAKMSNAEIKAVAEYISGLH